MDNNKFNQLPENKKASYNWDKGTYLATKQVNFFSINLYHVGKFFVEVWYDPKKNFVKEIRRFKSKRCLEPYLEKISINIF